MSIQAVKKEIISAVKKATEKAFGSISGKIKLVIPPSVDMGDFAVDCFALAKQVKKNPHEIANILASQILLSNDLIEKMEPIGPYVNFTLKKEVLFGDTVRGIFDQQINDYDGEGGKTVMVEYLSPNTNKPLHLGHMRNGALGMAVSNILSAIGEKVIKANLVNDRGVHICKSMLAWLKWGNGETPQSTGIKGDHFVGKWYVRYAVEAEKNVHLEEEVQEMLQQWEAGDPEVIKTWKMMNGWVYDGFSQTYAAIGLKFDTFYYESNTYKLGKDNVAEGLKKKVFYRDSKGNILFDLPQTEFGLGKDGQPRKATVLRSDGTSVYITQDIGTAILKKNDFGLDRSIYVVGSEQNHHFHTLFAILKALGHEWANECHHLSYGMVYLPDGKMKSREGKVVDADNLIKEMTALAAEEVQKRDPDNKLSESEMSERAAKIGIGAIKFYLLRVGPQQDIYFDPKESISFDGMTGPYCQYAYARICGISRKAEDGKIGEDDADFSLLGNKEEMELARKLIQFPDAISAAAKELNPQKVALHTYETAKAFNQFYSKHQVIDDLDAKLSKSRLALVKATAIVLKKGLNLLGIEALEKM